MVRSRHFRGYTRLGRRVDPGSRSTGASRSTSGPSARRSAVRASRTTCGCRAPTSGPAALPELAGDHRRVGRRAVRGCAHPAAALGGVAGQPARRVRRGLRRSTRHADQDRAVSGPRGQPAGRRCAQGLRGAHAAAGRAGQPGPAGAARHDRTGSRLDRCATAGRGIRRQYRGVARGRDGRLPARHRAPGESAARRRVERISVPYFFNPRLDAQIPVLSLPAELAARTESAAADDPSDPIFSVYGRNAWKSRLRAHPDVAAAHGYAHQVGSKPRIPFSAQGANKVR